MAKGKSKQHEDPAAKEPTAEETEQAAQAAWDGQPGHQVQLEEPTVYEALPVEHRAMQWTGENYEALRAFTSGAVELHSDGRTLGVQTTEGYVEAPVGHYICEDARGHFYPCDPEVHEAKYAPADEIQREAEAEQAVLVGGSSFAEACKRASPRELIDALINRIGRVESVRGVKWPPLRVMAQELRDARQSMEGHPALDEKRP